MNAKDLDMEYIVNTIKQRGLTGYELAKVLPLTEVGINKILSGESKKPRQSTLKILHNYLFSDDKVAQLSNETDKSVNDIEFTSTAIYLDNLNIMDVPLVSQRAWGSYLNGFGDPEYFENLPKVPWESDVERKGEYLCFEVKGDSMDDGSSEAYLEGDILLCRSVRQDYWKSKLHIHKWDFVIVHKDKGVVVKRIIKHDVENGIITLHSLNDEYDDYEVHLKDVAQIFNIVDFKRRPRSRR